MLVVSADGRLLASTVQAACFLRRYFGPCRNLDRLPRALRVWVRSDSTRLGCWERPGRMLVMVPLDRNRKGSIYYLLREVSLEHKTLTKAEMKVLKLIRMGNSNERIAQALESRVGTVKKHCQRIFPKLGVETRLEAAYHAPGAWVLP